MKADKTLIVFFKLLTITFLWGQICQAPLLSTKVALSGPFLWFSSLNFTQGAIEVIASGTISLMLIQLKELILNPSMGGLLEQRGIEGEICQNLNAFSNLISLFIVSSLGPVTTIFYLTDQILGFLSLLLSR